MHINDHADDLAKELAGNWRKFQSFGWHDRPDDADKWAIVYTHNRDSGLLGESNAAAIAAILDKAEFSDDVRSEHHGHWACGWVDGYAIRVYDAAGSITPAFIAYTEIHCALESYPVLDEEDFSRREYEATLENIASVGRRFKSDDAPEGWESEVYGWFSNNAEREVEPCDGGGGYPSDDAMKMALAALGWLDADYAE